MPSPPPPGAPRDTSTQLREAGFNAEYSREQMRYAPHLVFVKQLERLDEAMAALEDPYPAFEAWTSGLLSWATEDPEFWNDYDRLCALEDELFAEYGAISVIEYVGMWRPCWIGVMRRAGMFHGDPATAQAPTHPRSRLQNGGVRPGSAGASS